MTNLSPMYQTARPKPFFKLVSSSKRLPAEGELSAQHICTFRTGLGENVQKAGNATGRQTLPALASSRSHTPPPKPQTFQSLWCNSWKIC